MTSWKFLVSSNDVYRTMFKMLIGILQLLRSSNIPRISLLSDELTTNGQPTFKTENFRNVSENWPSTSFKPKMEIEGVNKIQFMKILIVIT